MHVKRESQSKLCPAKLICYTSSTKIKSYTCQNEHQSTSISNKRENNSEGLNLASQWIISHAPPQGKDSDNLTIVEREALL